MNTTTAADIVSRLSPRELQVFRGIARGEPVVAIARGLGLTISATGTYRTRAMRKLRLRSNVELAMRALAAGLVEWPGVDATASEKWIADYNAHEHEFPGDE